MKILRNKREFMCNIVLAHPRFTHILLTDLYSIGLDQYEPEIQPSRKENGDYI